MPSVDDLPPPPSASASGIDDLPPPPDTTGAAQAVLEHYGNMATAGYLPQLQAKSYGPMARLADLFTGDADYKAALSKSPIAYFFDDPNDAKTYVQDRDANINRLATEEKEHPIPSAAGSVIGAVASGAAMNAIAPINAASKIGRVAQAAKGGAIIGGISNPGDTQGQLADGFQMDDRFKNAATGAAIGGVTQGAVEGVTGAVKSASELPAALTGKAEERAFKSSGAMLKDYRRAGGQDRINELGRYMIDNGLVKPGMTVQDVQKGAEALQNQHGEAIGGVLKSLDDAGAAAPSHDSLATAIEQQAAPMKDLKTSQPTYNALMNVADDIRSLGKDKTASFQGAQDVKEFISDQIDKAGGWKAPNPSEKNLALRDAYRAVNGSIEDSAGNAAQAVGDQDLLNKYVAAKTGYRNSGDIAKIAEDQVNRQNANRMFSPSDYATGIGGAVIGAATGDDLEHKVKNAAIGFGAGLANKAVRTYGTALYSGALDRAGSMLGRTGVSSPAIAPAMNALRSGPAAAAAAEGATAGSSVAPMLRNVAQNQPNRAPARGEDLWAQQGLSKLGIQDQAMSARLTQDPRAKQLLIQASDLTPGSKAMKRIQDQLKQGWGR